MRKDVVDKYRGEKICLDFDRTRKVCRFRCLPGEVDLSPAYLSKI